ncbi:tyrosine-type recombinase/integrase [Streptomyces sp. NBC_01508]|uniref:tyrosine-type recombinase/integrase n=1 Tax=Streptomyces sp. NBC_01508 TaxID=2903888 RepID=UPI0038688913
MAATDVQQLLDHCPREGAVGIRDYAILMLLARLGLRSIEVARLQLDDVDWRLGEIAIRGKGRREDRLPLPVEVGEALVAYLSGAVPRGARVGSSLPAELRTDRSGRTWWAMWWNGPACAPDCPEWARTGCGTPWLGRCCGRAPG